MQKYKFFRKLMQEKPKKLQKETKKLFFGGKKGIKMEIF